MTTTPAIPVTVTPVALSRDVYNELLSGLDELDESYGKTAEAENARRYLHWRWLVEGQAQPPENEASK